MTKEKRTLDGGMVSFRADAELRQTLQEIADNEDRSVAQVARRLVQEGVNEWTSRATVPSRRKR